MLELPKVKKGMRRASTRAEKVQKVIASVALALGVALAGGSGNEVQAATAQGVQQPASASSGALLLKPSEQGPNMLAWHNSHSSHASHASHASHHSHYSSRY